jgi:uncharacterized protein (TIGR02118 family)
MTMYKLVFCLRRLPHLSRQEFQSYWRDTHAALVRHHAEVLHIRRYVQVHTLDDPLNEALRARHGSEEPYDGVAELWWDSIEEFQAGRGSPEARQAARELFEDERRFIDHPRSPIWFAEEHSIVSGSFSPG